MDNEQKLLIPFQTKRIGKGFRWKGMVYAGVMDCKYPIDGNNPYKDHVWDEYNNMPLMGGPQAITGIIDADTQYVKAGPYDKIINMVGDDGNTMSGFEDRYLLTRNEDGNMGIVNLDGKVIFPGLSFKFREIVIGRGDGIFYVKKSEKDTAKHVNPEYEYVNKQGRRLFPKLLMHDIEPTSYPGLYRVEYWKNGIQHFYYSRNGVAYTSADVE